MNSFLQPRNRLRTIELLPMLMVLMGIGSFATHIKPWTENPGQLIVGLIVAVLAGVGPSIMRPLTSDSISAQQRYLVSSLLIAPSLIWFWSTNAKEGTPFGPVATVLAIICFSAAVYLRLGWDRALSGRPIATAESGSSSAAS